MCDYSLEHVASRAAEVGDQLISTRFGESITRGFCAVNSPGVAVCLRPGTELAFDRDVEFDHVLSHGRNAVAHRVARFRQVDTQAPHVHHDALEFPDGRVVLITRLVEGQRATVLQLPAEPGKPEEKRVTIETPTEVLDLVP
ncbi:MAG: hypothetical protein IT536_07580 [Hyphomicrobiales bacterium]|nr:hypothetical protein [Hyphomicrobiales bacterium]